MMSGSIKKYELTYCTLYKKLPNLGICKCNIHLYEWWWLSDINFLKDYTQIFTMHSCLHLYLKQVKH